MKLKIVKKCLAAGIAVIFLCLSFTMAYAEVSPVYLGDADRDGSIGAGDARQILRFSVGLDSPDLNDLTVCDVDGDCSIGSADARFVLRVTVGIENLNGKIVSVGEAEPEPPVEEPQPVEPQPVYQVDPEEMEMLGMVICQEVGGESMELKLMVANVVINRVNSPYFPDTVYGVLTQPYQYSGVTYYGFYWPSWASESVRNDCRTAAYRVLSGERFMPENVVYQAAFRQGSGVYAYYSTAWDDIIFCYM